MARPYSPNLRLRVTRIYQNQEGSQLQIGQRFQVGLTFVRNLLRHYLNTGGVNPKEYRGGAKTKIEKNFDFLMSAENSTKTRYFTL